MDTRVLKDKEDLKKWDELIENSKHGTIFHKSYWLNTNDNLLNKQLRIYGCFEENQKGMERIVNYKSSCHRRARGD